MLISQFDKFVNKSTQEILGSEIERENLEPMLSTDIVRNGGNVTGVKGEKELYYRIGNVNLTSADIGALDEENVYNGLDQTNSGYALDARQGKVLDEAIDDKLNKANVYNGLDKTDAGYALDARQGKKLAIDIVTLSSDMRDPNKIIFQANTVTGTSGFHNSLYRGEYIGNQFTETQSQVILAGTFDGLYVGDYWTINGVDWVIVGFDIRYNIGDTPLATHHIGVMPRVSLNDSQWYTSNDTSHGYVGSTVRANIKANGGAQSKFIAAFGNDHVLSFRELYPSTYSSGNATGWAWVDARTELLSEVDVYGCMAWSLGGKGYEVGADKSQLPIFRLRPDFANIRARWWLRSVNSATAAAIVNRDGYAYYYGASNSLGVRPLSLIA